MSLNPLKLGEVFQKAGLSSFFTADSLAALARFTDKMLEINQTLNLTGWTEEEEVLNFHLLDSAFALPVLQTLNPSSSNPHWLDLGTGCGFPGVVLAAAFPGWQVTLVDSVAKKIKAVAECLDASELKSQTLCARAEDIGRDPKTREMRDGVTCRSVGDFRVVLECALPLLKTGGYLVNWMTDDQLKTMDKSEKALGLLQGKIVKTVNYSLPGGVQKRWLVIVEKMGKTSAIYPRRAGRPAKNPL
ncbi:MAG TPA: 16S rRNA (guanine(527)-N(7))-methyltransferase RsmG [bacterium]